MMRIEDDDRQLTITLSGEPGHFLVTLDDPDNQFGMPARQARGATVREAMDNLLVEIALDAINKEEQQ